MLSSKQLHQQYSVNPCAPRGSFSSPYSQLSVEEVFNPADFNDMGAGTPMNWLRIVNFFKHVKYPCLESAPGYSAIEGTGGGALALTFRFLQELDGEAYLERQPTVRAGTSHSVRNACDLARACKYIYDDTPNLWSHRMATEYLEHFAYNSLPDCLMMCGPDLVNGVIAKYYRAPGYKVQSNEPVDASGASSEDPGGNILNSALSSEGMFCFTTTGKGVAGAAHGCFAPAGSTTTFCWSCDECPTNPVTGEVINPDHPCCKSGSIFYYNECCNNGKLSISDRLDFSYWIPSDDGNFDGTISGGRVGEILKHIGILERKSYGGYANFTSQCSGSEPPIILKDMFLRHFQTLNGCNYDNNTFANGTIPRARTISLILKATVGSKADVNTNTTWMVNRVKDLLFNGYGVLLLTNVGFPSVRDSTGLVYPDRIFYQTYNIVGYDDTKLFYPETVYVLHCPFGDWITGGHPAWGKLPPGCFLVTENRLKCMIDYYPGLDFYGCRKKPCRPPASIYDPNPDRDCDNLTRDELLDFRGCGSDYEGRCDPFYCTKAQRACGFLFAISLNQGFPVQNLDHAKYYPINIIKKIISENTRRRS